jgi:hypothetical protein
VYAVSQVTEKSGADQASRALVEVARYVVHGQASNLTILPGQSGAVWAHERAGWARQDKKTAARALRDRIAAILDDQLDGAGETPLVALRPWLRERKSELCPEGADRIMANYLAAAERYYAALAPRPDTHDRREAARRILLTPALGPAIEHLPPPCPAIEIIQEPPPVPSKGASPPVLTDEDLAELLGW